MTITPQDAWDEWPKEIRSLINEIAGVWNAFEHGIRQEISNTNYAIVREKLTAVETLLAAPQPVGNTQAGRVPDREAFWLVERMGTGLYVKRGPSDLTDNVWHAHRFANEREAFDYARLSEAPWAKDLHATEHVFINKTAAPQPATSAYAAPLPDRDRMAELVYQSAHKGLNNCWQWSDPDFDHEHPGRRGYYYKIADGILSALSSTNSRDTP